jgi:DNA-directed RNA polymerase I subunit RPA1
VEFSFEVVEMNLRKALVHLDIKGVAFGLLSAEELRELSVLHIINGQTYDIYGNPSKGGLYDPGLGPIDSKQK